MKYWRSFGCLLLGASDILVECQEQELLLDAPDGLEDDHGDDEEEHPKEETEEGQATLSSLWVTRI